MRQVAIYALDCPIQGLTVYVGRTFAPQTRYKSHIAEALASSRGKKNKWIQGLIAAGHKPIMRVIEFCEQSEQKVREAYWINYYRQLNPALFNRVMPNVAIPANVPAYDDEFIPITVRIDQEIYDWVKANAQVARRSLNAQIGLTLEKYRVYLAQATQAQGARVAELA